jgi:chaperonin GroEL|tara:strand:- start:895 stop:2478 length:1584 start_codon:yes stop_codon:yes gene_type:complete
MEKKFDYGSTLHEKISKGVNKLADNVAATLGPRGRSVILQRHNIPPIITKDGVTIANFVSIKDPFENVGAQIVKEAASKTNEEAGDGTTTSTVLARALLNEAQKYLISGVPPIELKRGMDIACEEIIKILADNSKSIRSREDINHIASISANGDKKIGELIATAVDKVGRDGAITIEEARSVDTSLDLVEGFIFDSGYISRSFITDERKGAIKYEDCLVLVTDYKLDNVEEMLKLLELVAREGRPLLIVADEVEGQLLAALIMNSARGTMKVTAVKAPRYGEERRGILSDLAVATGAVFISRKSGMPLKDINLTHLGKAKTVEVIKNRTTIVGGAADMEKIDERIDFIKNEIAQEESINFCERLQERITRLASGIAVIRVGAATQIEMVEKKHRIEDALEAVRSAQLGGIHAGGGIPLVRASKAAKLPKSLTEEQKIGFNIVLNAVKEPIKQMARNAGESPDIIVKMIEGKSGNKGYDFATGKMVDLLKEGIIDPVRVTSCALLNAVSVVSTLITTGHAIIEVPDES